jgi:aryl-alcohol dehydrogenase-like predicted oxidoreductase
MNARDASVGRLALGTAQLGMPYGVANRRGQPSAGEAAAILDRALLGGIHCLDTAAGYGEAESIIGHHLRERAPRGEIAVVTKLAIEDDGDRAGVRAALAASRRRLGAAPDAALLHDPSLLARWDGPVGDALRACRADGEVGAIGVSIYTPEQFAFALELADIDVVQAPFSVLDRRLEQAGLLARAHARGVRVMLRSVFLQGLLTMEPADHPAWLRFAAAPLTRWREICAHYEVALRTAALRFALERTAPATVVVGCESVEQLEQLLAIASGPDLPVELVAELEDLASADRGLLEPTSWPV